MVQDWDRLIMVLLGGGVAAYTLYGAWKLWRQRQRKAAIGALLLAAGAVALPLVLMLRG